MSIWANHEGFTLWSDEGIILVDFPFERLKDDQDLCMKLLITLHKTIQENYKKELVI